MKFLLSTIFIQIVTAIVLAQNVEEFLKVTVYYETLCPFSIKFITEQLYPGYQKLNSSLIIDLVPYGNAKQNYTNGSWVFECQHGREECFGNKVHACALAEHKDQDLVMDFISCTESQEDPGVEDAVHVCAPKLQVPPSTLLDCTNGQKGNVLLSYYGDRTNLIKYLIPGVPSIFFNDEYNSDTNDAAAENFFETACKLFYNKPEGCPEDVKLINTNKL